jgi:hypothetical protein
LEVQRGVLGDQPGGVSGVLADKLRAGPAVFGDDRLKPRGSEGREVSVASVIAAPASSGMEADTKELLALRASASDVYVGVESESQARHEVKDAGWIDGTGDRTWR